MQTDKNQRINNTVSGIGKVPPQATDFEDSLLGSLMLVKNSITFVLDIVKPESFYRETNQIIYEAILNLFTRSQPTDSLSVTGELRRMKKLELIGGAYHLIEVCERANSAFSIEHYARIIEQKFMQREIIRISTECINAAYEDSTDVFELIEYNQSQIFSIGASTHSRGVYKIDDLVASRVKSYENKPKDGLTGVGTGWNSLNKLTNGWQPTDLIIIAARPAMGKTALALQSAKLAAIKHDVPVLIFSLEMSKEQLTDRLISSETDIYQDKLQRGDLTPADFKIIHSKIKDLVNSNIFIDDTPGLKMSELRAKARRLKEKHDIQLIVLDYLQLVKGEKSHKGNREQEISYISRELKIVAKELEVPVIALSQLSRAVESRPGGSKRPMLSDLRESGSIEQDADQVMFLYRPEYYGILEDEIGNSTIGVCEAIFAKNRKGVCDTAVLQFNGALMKFTDPSDLIESVFEKPNPQAGLSPSTSFERPGGGEYIIRPSRYEVEKDEQPPF